MTRWISDVIEINGLRLHYTRTGGDKPPLVLAHGFSEDGLVWTALAEVLEDEYDVIMPDARDHGQSDAAETGLGTAELASDLHGIISGLGLDKPAVLGHSMGGMTTFALAGLYPDVPGAILVEDGMPFEMRRTASENEGARDGLRAYFDTIKGKNHGQLMAWRRIQSPNWSETDVRTFADAKIRLNPQTLAPFMSRNTAASNVRTMASPVDWPTLLRQVRCPALLITGDPELGAMVTASQAATLQEQVSTLRVAHIANASHDVRRDQSDDFLAVISPFLAEWARVRVQ
ncbi:MAG TPA: alpha/beta hydrolase [Roseiflexaceae bacterium]|nr:alpha/beta hydrolase [Roseiflexaceae bacterium]